MILEVDDAFYETYPRKVCAGCFFKADTCSLMAKYPELECVDENGKPSIWKPMSKETLQRIIARLK